MCGARRAVCKWGNGNSCASLRAAHEATTRMHHEGRKREAKEEGAGERKRERFFNPLDYTRVVLITPSRTRLSFAAVDKNGRETGVTSLPHVVIYVCVLITLCRTRWNEDGWTGWGARREGGESREREGVSEKGRILEKRSVTYFGRRVSGQRHARMPANVRATT